MSNCIDIVHNSVVSLKSHQIDAVGLRSLIAKAEEEVNDDNCVSDDTSPVLKTVWWFLSGAVKFRDKGEVEIRFGRGRSGHTWRDFEGTLRVLSKYIKSSLLINFGVADEYDNFDLVERYSVNLESGEEVK